MNKLAHTAASMLVASVVAASFATLSAPVAQAIDVRGNTVTPLFDVSPCMDVVFVGVRGSGETGGDDGFGSGKRVRAVQDRFTEALTNTKVGVWEIDYPSESVDVLKGNPTRYFLGVDEGVNKTKAFLRQRSDTCKRERYVLAGYSQGAMVLHRAVIDMAKDPDDIAQEVFRRIDAIVAVADPDRVASDDIVTWGTTGTKPINYGVSKYLSGSFEIVTGWGYKLTYSKMSSFGYGLSGKWIQVCDSMDSVCDKAALAKKVDAARTSKQKERIEEEGNQIHGTHYTYTHDGLKRAARFAAAKFNKLGVTYKTLLGGQAGQPFIGEVYAKGGAGPYQFSVSGAIPPGVAVDSSGDILSGTPTTPGSYAISYTVTDAFGQKASGAAVIQITESASAQIFTGDLKMRAGVPGSVAITFKDQMVTSFEFTSAPLPGATLFLGQPTMYSTITWTPTLPGTYPFSVRVIYEDGSVLNASSSIQVFAVPDRSIAVSNVESRFVVADEWGRTNYSDITISLTKTSDTNTTPVAMSDLEDPASDFYSYSSGDVDGDGVMNLGETWTFTGYVPWYDFEPPGSKKRTVVLMANDSTGAPAFNELQYALDLLR